MSCNVYLLGNVPPHLTKQEAIETSNITLTIVMIKERDKGKIAPGDLTVDRPWLRLTSDIVRQI